MKKLIMAMMSGSICFATACHKPITTPEDTALDAISGSWELRQSIGGIAGVINYQSGNGNVFQFKNDHTYTLSGNNISQQGQYHLAATSRAGDFWLMRLYNSNNQAFDTKDSVRFDQGKLVFLPTGTCCDIATILYERIH